MFIAIQSHKARKYNNLDVHQQINGFPKIWYISVMDFHAVIKKNKIMAFGGKWIQLEVLLLGK